MRHNYNRFQVGREPDMVGFGPLFVKTHSRKSNPETSKVAAASVLPDVTEVKRRILQIFKDGVTHDKYYPRQAKTGFTDEELTLSYVLRHGMCGQSSIRSRRNDLTLAGKIRDSGQRRKLKSGRMGIVWTLAA